MLPWFIFHFWECHCDTVFSAGFGDNPKLFTRPFYYIPMSCSPANFRHINVMVSAWWPRVRVTVIFIREVSTVIIHIAHKSSLYTSTWSRNKTLPECIFIKMDFKWHPQLLLIKIFLYVYFYCCLEGLKSDALPLSNEENLHTTVISKLVGWLRKISCRRTAVIWRKLLQSRLF